MADVKKVIEIIDKIIADVDEQKLFLTELDNVIGDGDHGINLARGFDAVNISWFSVQYLNRKFALFHINPGWFLVWVASIF